MKFDSKRMLIGACGALNVLNLHLYLMAFQNVTDNINVILTRSACSLIQPKAIQAILGHEIFTDTAPSVVTAPHINLPRWADIFVVLPATANILGKAANGLADDLLSTTILSARTPIVFVPSMNEDMWQSTGVQRNVKVLEEDGHHVIISSQPRPTLEASSSSVVMSHLMPSPDEIVPVIEQCVQNH